jgi:hypothetical protein
MKLSNKAYIAEELHNKNYYLQKALDQANEIIYLLEKENDRLQQVIQTFAKQPSTSCCDLTKLVA